MIFRRASRIGIVIDRESVQCALLRGRRTVWSRTVAAPCHETLAALDRVLGEVPASNLRRFAVVAVGNASVQYRLIRGLPPLHRDRLIRSVLSQNCATYFLTNGEPLVTTGVQWNSANAGWAGAFDLSHIDALARASDAHGVSVRAVVPLAAFAGYTAAEIADLNLDHPLTYRPVHADLKRSRRHALAASIALVAALFLWASAPGLAASVALWRIEDRLAAMAKADGFTDYERAGNELTAIESEITRFVGSAPSPTMFLDKLALQLREGMWASAIRIDSAGGRVSLHAESARDAIVAIHAIPGIMQVELDGPITRATIDGGEHERIALRFKWSRSEARPAAVTLRVPR